MIKEDNYIGTHICFDIIVRDKKVLLDTGITERYLNGLVDEAEMTCLIPAQVFNFPYANEHIRFLEKLREEGTSSPIIEEALQRYDYNKTAGSGNSGIVVLSESHAASHGFPEKEEPFLSICLYSCKPFDVERIIKYTSEYWNTKRMDIVVITRFIGRPQKVSQLTIGELSIEDSHNLNEWLHD